MSSSALTRLQNWYARQCNGEWEHTYGVLIETLDNPGWKVQVDLAETSLEDVAFNRVRREASEHDWVHVQVDDGTFVAYGGKNNLEEILVIFTDWAKLVDRP